MNATPSQRFPDLGQKIKELARPGTVFGEPYREGDTTIITASHVLVRPGHLVASPVGAILISPKGVELRRFNPPSEAVLILLMVVASIFWLGMLMNPPWKPETNLLKQVRELIETIRAKSSSPPPTIDPAI